MKPSRLTILVMAVAALTAAVTVVGMNPVFAIVPPTCHNCGASELAPGQEAEIGPLPCELCAKDFAPGQEAERPGWDPNGAPKFAPGQEGLAAGVIGPPKKIQ